MLTAQRHISANLLELLGMPQACVNPQLLSLKKKNGSPTAVSTNEQAKELTVCCAWKGEQTGISISVL